MDTVDPSVFVMEHIHLSCKAKLFSSLEFLSD